MMRGKWFLVYNQALWFTIGLRATAEELLKEYKACESADYITYVSYFGLGHSLRLWRCREHQKQSKHDFTKLRRGPSFFLYTPHSLARFMFFQFDLQLKNCL